MIVIRNEKVTGYARGLYLLPGEVVVSKPRPLFLPLRGDGDAAISLRTYEQMGYRKTQKQESLAIVQGGV